MSATIKDVAVAAGVSTATVSRALHGDGRVATRTRQRVEEAARRLAYRRSVTATRLASGRHGAVALLVARDGAASSSEVLDGVCTTLSRAGSDCLLRLVDHDVRSWVDAVDEVVGKADGAVLVRPPVLNLRPGPLAVALVGHEMSGVSSAVTDVGESAGLAVGHLRSVGTRRVVVLTEGEPHSDMERALRRAAGARGLEVQLVLSVNDRDPDGVVRVMSGVVASSGLPESVICTSDRIVRGVVRSLTLHGFVPGADVRVLGSGSGEVGAELDVSMVVEPNRELGRCATEMVLGVDAPRIADRQAVRLAPQLAVRGSTSRSPSLLVT